MSGWWRGHCIEQRDGAWRYVDTGDRVADDKDRDCGFCGKANTPEGHDGCLGELPGVMNACCGHGDPRDAYVQLSDGRRLGGDAARAYALAVISLRGDDVRASALAEILRRGRR